MKNSLPPSDVLLVAIRAKCLDCAGNQRKEVERCTLKDCALYPYRSVKAIGNEHKCQQEIRGQIDLFDVLTGTQEEKAI